MTALPPDLESRRKLYVSPGRRGLMATTALQAAVAVMLAHHAGAQPAPNARPAGGQVVAGQATIGQTTATTTIDQSSQRAAVNWQSFDVGSRHTVQINNPNSSAVTLNRVVGPNPSQIAGSVRSNGQVIITNQAGVTVYKGAVINTAGLVVSAAGISNQNFMAGKLIFDQAAKPGAKIENQGEITVADRGLAALVAPQVANSGVIRANMGKVILAGAEAHTLDLYGDGLVSINVTKQVQTAHGATALVTNTGVIDAQGGSVLLTAQAVDGVVQTLVNAGGTIAAASLPNHAGKVVIAGRGGDVVVTGDVSTNGNNRASTGGTIVANTSGAVRIAPSAHISASGPAGGGVIALGTTLKRAVGGPSVAAARTAKAVVIAPGASLAADASNPHANGGRVTVLANDRTDVGGAITAKGGTGGNGGFVEVSGNGGFSLTGSIDVTAPLGNAGTILFDPGSIEIVSNGGTSGSWLFNGSTVAVNAGGTSDTWEIQNTFINCLKGNIVLQAQTAIAVDAPLNLAAGATSLRLETNLGPITVSAPINATGKSLSMAAGTSIDLGADLAANAISLNGRTGVLFNGSTVVANTLTVDAAAGGIRQSYAGVLNVGTLMSTATIGGNVLLPGVANAIRTIGLAVTGPNGALAATGNITINSDPNLVIAGNVVAGYRQEAGGQSVSISSNNRLVINGQVISGPGGDVSLLAGTTLVVAQQTPSVQPVVAADGAALLRAPTIVQTAGMINAGTVDLVGYDSISLSNGRLVATVGTIGFGPGPVTISGNEMVATVNSATDINVTGDLTQSGASYIGANGGVNVGGVLTQDGGRLTAVGSASFGGVTQTAGVIGIGGALLIGTGVPPDACGDCEGGPPTGAGGNVAGWAGSSAVSGSFDQSGGVIVANGNVDVFSTGRFNQGNGAMLAAGGTLGVTAASDISIAGTVAAAGSTGFMLLTTGQNASLTLLNEGRVAGTSLPVTAGDVVHGNALQAPNGTIVIASSNTQSVATVGFISAANSAAVGYNLFTPGAWLKMPQSVPDPPTLQSPNRANIIDPGGNLIPLELMGTAIEIGGRIIGSHLGLYAKNSINETGLAVVSAGTLTGSAGVLRNGVLPAGLRDLGWTDPTTFGWLTPGVDTVGNVNLISPVLFNNVPTVASFAATGNFDLADWPQQAAHTVLQIGTLQAGSAVQGSAPYRLRMTVFGHLFVEGVVSAGIEDGQARPGGATVLTATDYAGVSGAITVQTPDPLSTPPVIAAAPNGSRDGDVSIVVNGPNGRFEQFAGAINGGNVSISTDPFTGSMRLFGNNDGPPPNGRIIATQGTIALTSGAVTVGSGETIVAVNNGTDVIINGPLATSLNSLVQANRDITVNGGLTQGGGDMVAARDITLQNLAQATGTVGAGGTLSIGGGSGVAGWGGSSAISGLFEQEGGLVAAGRAVNIFTAAPFSQSSKGMLLSGGTLGVTAKQGINIAGTVSAAGGPSGVMLLASGGDAVISGLVAGPQLSVNGNIVGGNAVQAPLGTVVTPSGKPAFGIAGSVTTATLPVSGYQLVCAGCTVPPSPTPQPVPALALPSWRPPVVTTDANRIPLVLAGGSLNLNGDIFASTLGLYARTLITEGPATTIAAGVVTGSAGATSGLPAGLSALGWKDAAAIGWAGSVGNVLLGAPTNLITTLSDFSTTGNFTLQSASLTQIGTMTAGGAAALAVSNGPFVQSGGALTAATVSINDTAPNTQAFTLSAGSITATAGTVSFSTPAVTVGARELITTTGGGSDILFTGTLIQQAGSEIRAAGNVSAGALVQNGGVITDGGQFLIGSGGGSPGAAGSGAATGGFVQNGGSVLSNGPAAIFTPGVFSQGAGAQLVSAASVGITANGGLTIGGTIAATASNGVVQLAMPAGTLALTGTLQASNVLLTAPSSVMNLGGVISGNSVTVNGAGSTLTQLGTIAGSNVSINAASSTLAQQGTIAGDSVNITVPTSSVTLGGVITGTNVALAADGSTATLQGQITGSSVAISGNASTFMQLGSVAGGSVSISAPSSAVTLGGAISGTNVAVAAPGSTVTLQGSITGNSVAVTGPASSIVLAPGSSFAGLGGTGRNPLNPQPFPAPGTPGLYLQAGAIQNANPSLTVSGAPATAVTFAPTGGGTANLGNFQAPNTMLFLDLGNGGATGQIDVAGLQVRYGPATSAHVDLTGIVGNVSGAGAAAISLISPGPLNNYQLNNCQIGTGCLRTTLIAGVNGLENLRNLTTIPIINGLQDLQMGGMLQDFEDDDELPDVARYDYRRGK